MIRTRFATIVCALCGMAVSASSFAGTDVPEAEPNDTKAASQAVTLASGDTITGNSQGSVDRYLVQTPAAPLGIYRHELAMSMPDLPGYPTGAPGLSIAGAFSQLSGFRSPFSTDTSVQAGLSTPLPHRVVAWYGFGRQEKIHVTVGTSASVIPNYVLTLTDTAVTSSSAVPIVDAGTVAGGMISIAASATGGNTASTISTDLWVYDSNLNAIPGYGNDGEPAPATGVQCRLTRDFATPGIYYIALTAAGNSSGGLANNQTSPFDDRILTGQVLEFPDVVAEAFASYDIDQVISVTITDGAGVPHVLPTITKTLRGEIMWISFTVDTAATDTGACCNPDGSCTIASVAGCGLNPLTGVDNPTSTFQSATTCAAANCTQPPSGRCCNTDGSCTMTSSLACSAAYGQWSAGTCAAACPSTLTTAPSMGGWGGSSLGNAGCVFLDITATNAVDITALDLSFNTLPGALQTVQIWTRPGTYMGFDNSAAGWTQIGGVLSVTSAGAVPLSYVALPSSIHINAGETVGICVGSVNAAGGGVNTLIRYIDTNQNGVGVPYSPYSTPDITLSADRTRTALFAGTMNAPRGFAGRVYYTTATTPTEESCCRGTTCNPVAAGTCTGLVAGSNSIVRDSCGGGTAFASCCYADFNHDGTQSIDDLFLYFNAYFTNSPFANFAGDGVAPPVIDDLFLYINAYFGTCS